MLKNYRKIGRLSFVNHTIIIKVPLKIRFKVYRIDV